MSSLSYIDRVVEDLTATVAALDRARQFHAGRSEVPTMQSIGNQGKFSAIAGLAQQLTQTLERIIGLTEAAHANQPELEATKVIQN